MSKKLLIIIGSVVAVAVVAVAVFFGLNTTNTSTPEPTKTSTPLPTSNAETFTAPIVDKNAQLAMAKSLFPNVTGVGTFSKEDVQLAMLTAYNYNQAATTAPYIVSGMFAADNLPQKEFDGILGIYLTPEAQLAFFNSFAILRVGDSNDPNTKISSDYVVSGFNNVNLGSEYTAVEGCNELDFNPCFVSPPKFGAITANVNDAGKLFVEQTVSLEMGFINKDGKKVVLTREYQFIERLELNAKPLNAASPAFLIDYMNNGVKSSLKIVG